MPVAEAQRTSCFSILDIPIAVTSDVAGALDLVDETYAAFRLEPSERATSAPPLALALRRCGDTSLLVTDASGAQHRPPTESEAALCLLDRIVHAVLAELTARGCDAIHAGAVVHRGRATIIAGASGRGKTTLTLGLVARGLGLLSDEFAVVEPGSGRILPYRRSVHVRPGTPELIPALSFVADLPRHELGGGTEWSVEPAALERELPGCLGAAAPLGAVLLLDGPPEPGAEPVLTPIAGAVAAMELLRGTWSASRDFPGALRRIGRLLGGVACARLRAGALEPTLDAVIAWSEGADGG